MKSIEGLSLFHFPIVSRVCTPRILARPKDVVAEFPPSNYSSNYIAIYLRERHGPNKRESISRQAGGIARGSEWALCLTIMLNYSLSSAT